MRIDVWQLTVSTLLLAACLAGGTVDNAAAEVRVNVNLGPPPIAVYEPPEMVLVPNSNVYFVPGYDFDVFFYNGYWWFPRGDRWYRSRAYNGPWRTVHRRYIPVPVYGVPRDFRRVYGRERHIPYGEWRREWRDHDRGRRGEGREHRGRDEHWDRGENGGRGEHRGRD